MPIGRLSAILFSMTIAVGSEQTSVETEGSGDVHIILAHGAGGSMNAKTILRLKDELLSSGYAVTRFNFLYKEQGKGMPDRMPKLMECYRAVADHVRETALPGKLVCGGHSMGGRTASHLAAAHDPMSGLLLLAYPLHPDGKPEKLRIEHLPNIQVPTLCINGTRDALCTRELMEEHRPKGKHWTMHWLENADHSYKAAGRKPAEVFGEIRETIKAWVDTLEA
jgi:predicted alpha/beta-hydrolase family hydrolase